jgi:hypothetical protein
MSGVVLCCSDDGLFWVCCDTAEECSAFVCGEMIMAHADDEVNGKNQPNKMPTTSEHQLHVVTCAY